MAKVKVYLVTDNENRSRLVRATSRAMAIGYCARNSFKAQLASQDDIINLMSQGNQKIDDATKDDGE